MTASSKGSAAAWCRPVQGMLPRAALWGLLALALCGVPAPTSAQQVPKPNPPTPVAADRDLITRYRFSERYTASSIPSEDGSIGQYRVGFTDDPVQLPSESATGEAKSADAEKLPPPKIQHLVYTERPAEVSSLGQVKSLVRQYERVRISGDGNAPPGPNPIEGMTIWYKPRIEELPQVVCMTEGRHMRYGDYWLASRQLFVPDLASLLPTSPVRIGDTWGLTKMAVRLLISVDKVLQGNMEGKLVDIRSSPSGNEKIAVIEISGRILVRVGVTDVNTGVKAELHFAFPSKRVDEALAGTSSEEATVDARGAIVRLSLGQSTTYQSAADKKPIRAKKELVMERQLIKIGNNLLDIPRGAPKATPENSWLTYVDPQQRFLFRHPQDLFRPIELGMPSTVSGSNKLELIHWQPGSRVDHVTLEIVPDEQRKPEDVKKAVLEDWKDKKLDFLEGAGLWLPENEWPGMKTYRFEAAIVAKGRSTRVDRLHFDGYVIHFRPNASLIVSAMTPQDPPIRFRKEVEAMLKTFQWAPPKPAPGTPDPAGDAPAAAPAAASPAAPAAPAGVR
jgi:hypothetical protein